MNTRSALGIGLSVCALALAPATVAAGDSIYRGAMKTDPAAKVSFALVKSRGQEKVVRIEVENVDLTCEGEGPDRLYFDPKSVGPAIVRNDGSWSPRRSGSVDMHGQFSRNRRRAHGTFEFDAQLYGSDGTGPTHCFTGKLEWRVERR